ncbi:MAG: hypothetical protein WD200_03330 [Candidatus Andersenbacteria bacterium]
MKSNHLVSDEEGLRMCPTSKDEMEKQAEQGKHLLAYLRALNSNWEILYMMSAYSHPTLQRLAYAQTKEIYADSPAWMSDVEAGLKILRLWVKEMVRALHTKRQPLPDTYRDLDVDLFQQYKHWPSDDLYSYRMEGTRQ